MEEKLKKIAELDQLHKEEAKEKFYNKELSRSQKI